MGNLCESDRVIDGTNSKPLALNGLDQQQAALAIQAKYKSVMARQEVREQKGGLPVTSFTPAPIATPAGGPGQPPVNPHAPQPIQAVPQRTRRDYDNPHTVSVKAELPKLSLSGDSQAQKIEQAYEFPDGSSYLGQWLNGKKHGVGTQSWVDGSSYEGQWQADQRHGRGRHIFSDGDYYEGDWQNDRQHGRGTFKHFDGATFEGNWVNGRQEGEGSENWPNGATYRGYYKNGKKNGKGTFKWADGASYDGEFVDGYIQNGNGVVQYPDGRRYQGGISKSQFEGKGTFSWPDNRKYEGEYKRGLKEGRGIFFWPNGKKYDGDWSQGKPHGSGTLHEPGAAAPKQVRYNQGNPVEIPAGQVLPGAAPVGTQAPPPPPAYSSPQKAF